MIRQSTQINGKTMRRKRKGAVPKGQTMCRFTNVCGTSDNFDSIDGENLRELKVRVIQF